MAVKTVQTVINGQTYTLTLNSSTGKYEATVTAPSESSYNQSGHYYPVKVTATDEAGNSTSKDASDSTLGSSLRLTVKEKVAPVIAIVSPTAGSFSTNSKPTITWKVTDADSGVNPATIGITLDSGTKVTGDAITKTAITGGYQCTYTPATALSDGSHTIKLNSGTAESVTVGRDGSFTKDLTLANGTNTITVVATDSAGKSTTVTRTVTLDTGAPVIKSVTLTPNPVDCGKTFVISVEVTD